MARANTPNVEAEYTCAVDPLANKENMLANREESIYAIWRAFPAIIASKGAPNGVLRQILLADHVRAFGRHKRKFFSVDFRIALELAEI